MTFRMSVQLWNTNTPAFVSCAADLTESYSIFQWSLELQFMYIAGKLVYSIVLPSNQLAINYLPMLIFTSFCPLDLTPIVLLLYYL